MRSRKAAGWRETTISPLITQRVCDFQVLIFVSSWSITGLKWFPKWAAQGRSCVNPFSIAFPLWVCSEHSEPERVGRQSHPAKWKGREMEPAWGPRWCFHPNFAMYPLCDLGPVTSPLWALSLFISQGCCEAPHQKEQWETSYTKPHHVPFLSKRFHPF